MCLGIPGQITQIWQTEDNTPLMGKVDFGGVSKAVCLSFTPAAQVGDYVMVHVGFAISQIDQEEAERTLALLAQIGGLAEIEAVDEIPG